MTIGERLQHYRKSLNLSQEELGQRLLVSRQTISQWETDQTMPTLDNLIRLRDVFGVSIDSLLIEEDFIEQTTPKEEPLEAYQFRFTAQELQSLYKSRLHASLRLPGLFLAILLILTVHLLLQPDHTGDLTMIRIIVVGLFTGYLFFYIARLMLMQKRMNRLLESIVNNEYSYRIYQDRFAARTEKNGREVFFSEVPFQSLASAEEKDAFLLLVDQNNLLHVFRKADLDPQSVLLQLPQHRATKNAVPKETKVWNVISWIFFILSILSLPISYIVAVSATPFPDSSKALLAVAWKLAIFLPLPIGSVIIGCILKSKKLPHKRNLIVGIIMSSVLAINAIAWFAISFTF